MCVIDDTIPPVLLFEKYVRERIFNPLHSTSIWLIWDAVEAWSDRIEVGKQFGEQTAQMCVELLCTPVKLKDDSGSVASLNG